MNKDTPTFTVLLTNPEVIMYKGKDVMRYYREIHDMAKLKRAGLLEGREIRAFRVEPMDPETHGSGCVCADCAGADLTADND